MLSAQVESQVFITLNSLSLATLVNDFSPFQDQKNFPHESRLQLCGV